MSCGKKIHAVRKKWEVKRQKELEQEEIDKRGIPVEGWPGVEVKKEQPAKVSG